MFCFHSVFDEVNCEFGSFNVKIELIKDGVITEEDFQSAKNKLLS